MTTSIESGALDQVREILFGALQRDFERKIAQLETRLNTRFNDVQQESRRRVEVIEAHLQKETENLSARLDRELVDLREAVRGLTRENRETASAVEQRVAKLEENFVRAQHDLRQQILDQAKSFIDEVHRVREELSDAVIREFGELEVAPEEEPSRRDTHEALEQRPSH